MPSVRARAKLARAAARLNEARTWGARALPPLILMTDDERLPDPVSAARLLPKGSAIVLRHREAGTRARLAAALKRMARERGLTLLIAEDAELAVRLDADGLHLSEAHAAMAAYWRARHPAWIITVAAHSERALGRAALVRADAALLAPVFETKSHRGRRCIGSLRARFIASRARLPVYALGGINAENIERLANARLAGIAAIDALLAD